MTFRVLHITNSYLPNVGGMEQHIRNLTLRLPPLGAEPRILTVRPDRGTPAEERLHGVYVRRIGPGPFLRRTLPAVRDTVLLSSWVRAIRKERPDLIHVHAPFAPIFRLPRGRYTTPLAVLRRLRALSCPVVATYHGLFGHFLPVAADRDAMHARGASLFIGVDRGICRDLHTRYGVPRDRIVFVPNGVDQTLFRPGEKDVRLLRELGLNDRTPLVLVPRRIDPKNGIEFAVKAFARVAAAMPDARLLLLGFDLPSSVPTYAQEVHDLVRRLHLEDRVLCHGGASPEDMPRYYRLATVTVIPSVWEATSLAALESMSCGVPVLASDVGGLPDVVDERCGVLVPPRDEEKLGAAIIGLLQDKARREQLAAGALARARTFDWDTAARTTRAVYRLAMEEAQPHGET